LSDALVVSAPASSATLGPGFDCLALGASGAKWMSPLAEKIITRLMGLLLAALAVQFLFNGLKGEGGLFVR